MKGRQARLEDMVGPEEGLFEGKEGGMWKGEGEDGKGSGNGSVMGMKDGKGEGDWEGKEGSKSG